VYTNLDKIQEVISQFTEVAPLSGNCKGEEVVPVLNYVGVLISLWLFLCPIFLFAAQPKIFFLDVLKKLEQRSHKCVELRGEYVE
jgi:hypothetical protein